MAITGNGSWFFPFSSCSLNMWFFRFKKGVRSQWKNHGKIPVLPSIKEVKEFWVGRNLHKKGQTSSGFSYLRLVSHTSHPTNQLSNIWLISCHSRPQGARCAQMILGIVGEKNICDYLVHQPKDGTPTQRWHTNPKMAHQPKDGTPTQGWHTNP